MAAPLSHAQTPRLLANVNTTPVGNAASQSRIASFGLSGETIGYFRYDDGIHGPDLWRTDGTREGTFLVADLPPVVGGTAAPIAEVGTRLLIAAGSGYSTRTGLLGGGNARLESFPGRVPFGFVENQVLSPLYAAPSATLDNGRLIFPVLNTAGTLQQLIAASADGSTFTTLLDTTNLPPGSPNALVSFASPVLRAFDNAVVFPVNQSSNFPNPALWKTDGTPQGTLLVRTFPRNNPSLRGVDWLTRDGGDLIFTAPSAVNPNFDALWKAEDADAASITELKNEAQLAPGSTGFIKYLVRASGRVYFVVNLSSPRLGFTDGTPTGTLLSPLNLILDLNSVGNRFADASLQTNTILTPFDSGVAFIARTAPGQPRGLYIGDGTTDGTRRLVVEGAQPVAVVGVATSAAGVERLIFTAQTPAQVNTQSASIYTSDGTNAGTSLFATLPAASSAFPFNASPLCSVGNRLVFGFQTATLPRRGVVYSTDGTPAGTRLLIDPAAMDGSSGPQQFLGNSAAETPFGSFSATSPASGFERFNTTGTPESASLCAEAVPGTAGVVATFGAASGNNLFTLERTQTVVNGSVRNVHKLYVSRDGCSDRRLVTDFGVANGGIVSRLGTGDGNGRVVFAGPNQAQTTAPWVSDGTAEGTRRLMADRPDEPFDLTEAVPLGENLLFVGLYLGPNQAVTAAAYVTDGTEPGTFRVTDLPGEPGVIGQLVQGSLRSTGSRVFFLAQPNGQFVRRLYVTDGTPAGTRQVGTSYALSTTSNFSQLATLGERIVAAPPSAAGTNTEPYISNPDNTDMLPLADINPGPVGSTPTGFATLRTPAGDRVLFFASDPLHGSEPRVTDGTAEGTSLLADTWPGVVSFRSQSAAFAEIAVLGPRAYFAVQDGEHGIEPWVTDGTPTGTRLLADLNPGPASSRSYVLGALGGRVLLGGYRPDVGIEPFTLYATPCPADFNDDARVDPDDLSDFITCFFSTPPCPRADIDTTPGVNPDDLCDFIVTFFAGCGD
jgi:ELWxxDGT repeat protein